jgi:hypothetical protein
LLKTLFQDRTYDLTLIPYGGYFDPAIGYAKVFNSATIGSTFGNVSGYSNPKIA